MKLLLDENLPKKLKLDFAEHEIYTVSDMGWNGKKNGELLQLMLVNDFDALLTFDKNLQYQQNFKKYSLPVLVLLSPKNTYHIMSEMVSDIKIALGSDLLAGPTCIEYNAAPPSNQTL